VLNFKFLFSNSSSIAIRALAFSSFSFLEPSNNFVKLFIFSLSVSPSSPVRIANAFRFFSSLAGSSFERLRVASNISSSIPSSINISLSILNENEIYSG
jgi:hypothetical protein